MRFILSLLACALAAALQAAEPDTRSGKTDSKAGEKSVAKSSSVADVKGAAKKLADRVNYAWTASPRSEGNSATWRQGPTEGKTEKNGFTYFTLTIGDNTIEGAIKGDKRALKRENDWESLAEIETDNAYIASRLKAFKAPAAEAEDLVNNVKSLKKEGDGVYFGELTEDGVKKLFIRRSNSGDPKDPKGSAKFWIKDGLLVKYEFNVQGKITTGQDDRELDINRTTTVEIKEVDSTNVQVPGEAKKKLS